MITASNKSAGPGVCEECWRLLPVACRLQYKATLWQHGDAKDINATLNHVRVQLELFREFIERTVAEAGESSGPRFPWEGRN